MNDTHGVEGKGWYAFDLDGTLAKYEKWEGIDHIGEPVKPMVDLMKKMHADGKVVKILTARVAPRANAEYMPNPYYKEFADPILRNMGCVSGDWYREMYRRKEWTAKEFIIDWCRENLGFLPEITHEKDHLMLMLFDDRVKQVIPNDGRLVEDICEKNYQSAKTAISDLGWALSKVESKRNGFMAGMMLGMLVWILSFGGVRLYEHYFEKKPPAQDLVEKLVEAAHAVLECDFKDVK